MALEVATYISELVSSNPVGAIDFVSQGDDHFRMVKAVLQNTFPNASKMFRFPTSVAPVVGNYTVVFPDDMNKIIPINAEAAGRTVTLPVPSGVHQDGFKFQIIKADNSDFLVTISGGTINGNTSLILYQKYQRVELIWSQAAGAWYADREEAVPIGMLAPWGDGSVVPEGWLAASQLTIGNTGSGATALASGVTRGLFYHLWNRFSDAICPVGSGRGGSASADFAGGKQIALLDMRGYTWAGLDNIGGSDASRLSSANTPGLAVGAETVVLVQANLPNVSLTTDSAGVHSHTEEGNTSVNVGGGGFGIDGNTESRQTSSDGAHTHNVPLGGSDTPVNKMQPTRTGGWIIKL
jgi:hypothetical protein